MSKKAMLIGMLTFFLLMTVLLSVPHAKAPDLPPGVPADMWIPLSENSGVFLNINEKSFSVADKVARGTLFVKVNNAWHRLYLNPGPAVLMPVK